MYYGGNTYATVKYLLNISQVLNTILAKETPLTSQKYHLCRVCILMWEERQYTSKIWQKYLLGAGEKSRKELVFEDQAPEGH